MFESDAPPMPGNRTLAGYCLMWGVPATIQRAFVEVFERGSVGWSDNLAACLRHDRDRQIATLHHGLRIAEDDHGLWVEVDCPHNDNGDRWLEGVRCGKFTGWSVAFIADRSATKVLEGTPWCTVELAELIEVSLVHRPAHNVVLGRKSALRFKGIIGPFDQVA